MMKMMKRLTALALAALMASSLAAPAYAEGETDGNDGLTAFAAGDSGYVPGAKPASEVDDQHKTARIYIAEPIGELNTGHTYSVYQILAGKGITDADGNPVLASLKKGYSMGVNSALTPDQLLGILNDPDKPLSEKDKDIYRDRIDENKVYAIMENSDAGAVLDVEPGYYLLLDETSSTAYPIYGMAVDKTLAGMLRYEPKAKLPDFKKEVRDNSKKNTWGDHADFSFSGTNGKGTPYLDGLEKFVKLEDVLKTEDLHRDVVAFRLTATLGENLDLYDSYKLIFHDKLPYYVDYLEINNGECLFRVEVVDKDENPKFETFNCLNNGKIDGEFFSFTPSIKNDTCGGGRIHFVSEDVKQAFMGENGKPVKLEPGDQVRVTYYAYTQNPTFPMGDDQTNDDWVVTNKAILEYSNNPMSDQMGHTNPEEAKLYSYNVMVLKTNKGGDPLTGATFALRKKDNTPGAPENTWISMSGRTEYDINDRTYGQLELGVEYCMDSSDPVATNMWFWKQIDAGEYELVETGAPDGFDTLERPIHFNVVSGLKNGKWTVDITTPEMDKNDAVMSCAKETVYTFVYAPDLYAEDAEDLEIYLVYLPESSPIYQNKLSADNRYFPDGLNLMDLVAAAKDGNFDDFAEDNKGGGWQVADPDNQYIESFECEALTITVRNFRPDEEEKSFNLPSTGGIGTTLFYVIGGVMVVGAGVILITRKRVKKEDISGDSSKD